MEHIAKQETAFVGIETNKLLLKIVLLSGGQVLCKVVENDLAGYRWLRSWLQRNDVPVMGLRVCMRLDAPFSEAPAQGLVDMGMLVCDAQSAPLVQFVHEFSLDETAAHSAVVLAHYCAAARPDPWTPPSPAYVELRLWLRRLQAIQQVRKQEVAHMEEHLQNGQQALCQLMRQQISCLDAQICAHEALIKEHVRRHPGMPKPPELAGSRRNIARYAFGHGIASGR